MPRRLRGKSASKEAANLVSKLPSYAQSGVLAFGWCQSCAYTHAVATCSFCALPTHPPWRCRWDTEARYKIRIVCARPYHALFMNNMLIRPTEAELANFG